MLSQKIENDLRNYNYIIGIVRTKHGGCTCEESVGKAVRNRIYGKNYADALPTIETL